MQGCLGDSVKQPTLDFCPGHDHRVLGSGPMWGSPLSVESTWGFSLPLPLPPLPRSIFLIAYLKKPVCRLSYKCKFSSHLGKYHKAQLLDRMVRLSLALQESGKLSFKVPLPFCIFFKDFIYLFQNEWVSEREHKQGQRESEKTLAEQGARLEARSQDPAIMTWAKGRHLTSWAAQALPILHFHQ